MDFFEIFMDLEKGVNTIKFPGKVIWVVILGPLLPKDSFNT